MSDTAGPHPFDAVFIQPMVFPLDHWIPLRRRLALAVEEARTRTGEAGSVWHVEGDTEQLFDRRLDGVGCIVDAYRFLLSQVLSFPCASIELDDTPRRLSNRLAEAPAGFRIQRVAAHLVVPAGGDPVVLHMLSGFLDDLAALTEDRLPQRELRLWYQGLLDDDRADWVREVQSVLGGVVGEDLGRDAGEQLEPTLGHMWSFCHTTSPDLIRTLGSVHRIEEGTDENEARILMPGRDPADLYAHFGWSYTTVAGPDRSLLYRLLFPLTAVNLAWYRYRHLRGDLIDLSRDIHALTTDRDLIARTEFYNQAVLDVKVWEAERESFERSLKPVYRSVYDRLWTYWDTGESRDTVHEGIDYVRDFLDRKYSVKLAMRENTQAKILFVIAIFQLLSVFGLVSGYLYFWEQTPLPEELIYDSPLMMWATLLSPVAVLVLITWLLLDFFRRHQ